MYIIRGLLQKFKENYRKVDGLKSLMANYLLSQFANGMVTSFGVLFIYQLSDSFKQGVFYIFSFYLLQRLAVAILIPFVGRTVARIGHRRVMVASLLAFTAKIWLFTQTTSTYLLPLLPALLFGGLTIAGYYLSFHSMFIDDNDDAKIGEQMGILTMLGRASWIAGPLLAGILTDTYGFSIMFAVVLLIILFSIIPLLMMKTHPRHKETYSTKKVTSFITDNTKFSSSIILWYIADGIQTFFWPIFVIISLGTYTKFGLLGSSVYVLNSAAVYFAGKIYDKDKKPVVFNTAAVLVSVTWTARMLSKSPTSTVLSDVSNRLVSPFWWMKLRRNELTLGEKGDSLVFGAAHEIVTTIGILMSLIIGYLILTQTQGMWLWFIPVTVITTFIATLLMRGK